jgi:hypothetical protein
MFNKYYNIVIFLITAIIICFIIDLITGLLQELRVDVQPRVPDQQDLRQGESYFMDLGMVFYLGSKCDLQG